ncbi:hypothetical protein Q5752_004122 [Cryptotrichosporon argae]
MENGHVNGEPSSPTPARRTSSLFPLAAPIASSSTAGPVPLETGAQRNTSWTMKTPPRGPLPPIPSSSSSSAHPFAASARSSPEAPVLSPTRRARVPSDASERERERAHPAFAVSRRTSSLDPSAQLISALSPERRAGGTSGSGTSGAGTSGSRTPNGSSAAASASDESGALAAAPGTGTGTPAGPSVGAGTPGSPAARVPSRQLLQAALDLAQRAVEMDKHNDVLGALAAYRDAVDRLRVVMERVGVEPKEGRRRGKTEEEGRTLRGIHDAYLARIQLLAEYEHDDSADVSMTDDDALDDGQAAIGSLMLAHTASPRRPGEPSTPVKRSAAAGSLAPPSLHHALTPQTARSGESADVMSPSPSHGREFTSPRRRLRSGRLAAHGLEDEADLSGIDGVDGGGAVEELVRTPRDESFADADERRAGAAVDAKSLPPLPSAPSGSGSGSGGRHARSSSRKSSVSGVPLEFFAQSPSPSPSAGAPASPSASSLAPLVSPSTAHGTISQRRHQRTPAGQSMSSISELDAQRAIDGLPSAHAPHPYARQVPSPVPPSPALLPPAPPTQPSPLAQPSPPAPSGPFQRLRAKSQPGHRPSQVFRHSQPSGPAPDVPPVPPLAKARAAHRPSASAHLRLNPDALAPPVAIPARPAERGLRSAAPSPRLDADAGAGAADHDEPQPAELAHRPFHLLRLLAASMDDAGPGAHLSPSIHVGPAMWHAATWSAPSKREPGLGPPKIAAQETKARAIETLLLHLDALRVAGRALLDGARDGRRGRPPAHAPPLPLPHQVGQAADEFVAALDSLDDELDNAHRALSGKGVVVGAWKGKTGASGKSWGSRFSRSVDKMTTGKSADSPEKYVDLLLHLCHHAQVINDHLACFTGPCTPAYHALPEPAYRQIEARVLRAAHFFAAVVAPFVLDDFRQFLLRYLKGGIKYLED